MGKLDKRYEISSASFNCLKVAKSVGNGKIVFDNPVQRSMVWTPEQKSLLVSSILLGLPISDFYANKKEDGVFDIIDGQQRLNTISEFVNNKFRLKGLDPVPDDEGNKIDINGLNHDEIPEDLKTTFNAYSIKINCFENITQDEVADIFYRMNSGTQLKPIDKRLAKAKSIIQFNKVAEHSIFDEALTKAARAKRADKDITTKSFVMLKEKEPCWDARFMDKFIKESDITDEDAETLMKVYDKLLDIYNDIYNDEESDPIIKNSVVARRILGRNNISTLVPFIRSHIDEDITSFLKEFFTGDVETKGTISTRYNEANHSGSGHKEQIRIRMEEIDKYWEKKTTL